MSRGHCHRKPCVNGPGVSSSLTRRNEKKVRTELAASKHDPSPKFHRRAVPLWWGGQRESQFALLPFQKHVSGWRASHWCVLMRDFPPISQPVTLADSELSHTEDKWSQSMVINHIWWWQRQELTSRQWKIEYTSVQCYGRKPRPLMNPAVFLIMGILWVARQTDRAGC